MSFDSDVALMGTGAAPLVAALHLLAEGKSVILLNPDRDFFLEDSELPFDPLFSFGWRGSAGIDSRRLRRNSTEAALHELRPEFPGAVEYWSGARNLGLRDLSAPFVRARSRLWVTHKNLDLLEELYVLASDAGYSPRILEGLQVSKRFPGAPVTPVTMATHDGSGRLRGLSVPRIYDVDVARYRNGLLEFARERSHQVVCNATQLELIPDGIRYHADGRIRTARLREGLLVYWTPRLTQWVLKQARHFEVTPVLPRGIRLWEQWSLVSRSAIDPGVVGVYGDCAAWAEVEGDPSESASLNRMAMLRAGPLMSMDSVSTDLLDAGSFGALNSFFYEFLRWEKVTVRTLKQRAIFEWDEGAIGGSWMLSKQGLRTRVVTGCDGPLADVVRIARQSCGELL